MAKPGSIILAGPLANLLEQELKAGNEIKENWQGNWPFKETKVIFLRKPFLLPIQHNLPNIEFRNINDIHFWKDEYYDTKYEEMLVCGFDPPPPKFDPRIVY